MKGKYSPISSMADSLLKELGVKKPRAEQVEAASSFILEVIYGGVCVTDKRLSPQESSCLYMTALGKSSQDISKLLRVSVGTVNTHKTRLKKKLKCRNMAHAIYKGMEYTQLPQHIPT